MVLLAVGFWLVYRRGLNQGRKTHDEKKDLSEPEVDNETNPSDGQTTALNQKTPAEAWVPWNLELEGRSIPNEMEGGNGRVELP